MIFADMESTMRRLYKYCLSLTKSVWQAEDLVQETLLKAYNVKSCEPGRILTISFLYTTAKNLFIDEKRRRRDIILFKEDFYGGMGDYWEYDSLIEILFSILPLQQAMLITLKDVFSYTVKEIACMLRTSEEAIKTSLYRFRKRLKTTSIDSVTLAHTKMNNQKLFLEISQEIKENHTMKLFLYSRILSSRNYHVRRNNHSSSFHVADPDWNILEIVS